MNDVKIFNDLFVKGNYKKFKPNKNLKNKYGLKLKYIRAIYVNHLHNHIIRRHPIVKHKLKYIKLTNPIKLSKKLDYPPNLLLKMLIKYFKFQPSKKLEEKCLKLDYYNNPDYYVKSKYNSYLFEKKLQKLFNSNNYKTEEQLKKEKYKLTPDILFTIPFIYENKSIFWIDGKNYFGGYNKFTISTIVKQYKKYNDYFGEGMFVFRYGYSKYLTSKLKNITIVSYDEIKKKKMKS